MSPAGRSRMPTNRWACRRRGVPPAAIRDFIKAHRRRQGQQRGRCRMFELSCARRSTRRAAAAHGGAQPLSVTIENYPEGQVEELEAVINPDDPAAGSRKIKFARELYIEQDDFMENPPKKFFPAVARHGSAAALCLFHHLPRGGEERRRRGDRVRCT